MTFFVFDNLDMHYKWWYFLFLIFFSFNHKHILRIKFNNSDVYFDQVKTPFQLSSEIPAKQNKLFLFYFNHFLAFFTVISCSCIIRLCFASTINCFVLVQPQMYIGIGLMETCLTERPSRVLDRSYTFPIVIYQTPVSTSVWVWTLSPSRGLPRRSMCTSNVGGKRLKQAYHSTTLNKINRVIDCPSR